MIDYNTRICILQECFIFFVKFPCFYGFPRPDIRKNEHDSYPGLTEIFHAGASGGAHKALHHAKEQGFFYYIDVLWKYTSICFILAC